MAAEKIPDLIFFSQMMCFIQENVSARYGITPSLPTYFR
jgi:hypothetical protein